MADTTAITITAIVTTGIVSGVLGPWVAARLEGQRDERRFRHERVMHDAAEVRAMIDETAEKLDAVVGEFDKVARWRNVENLSLVNDKGVQVLDRLQSVVVELERTLPRLIRRVGEGSSLTTIARQIVDVAHELELDLAGVANTMDVNWGAAPSGYFVELDELFQKVEALKTELRPRFDAAAHGEAGAVTE
jgi:hypothetical protein